MARDLAIYLVLMSGVVASLAAAWFVRNVIVDQFFAFLISLVSA